MAKRHENDRRGGPSHGQVPESSDRESLRTQAEQGRVASGLKRVGSGLLVFAMALALAACARVVTHEAGSMIGYDHVQDTAPDATFNQSSTKVPAYEGSRSAKAHYSGSGGGTQHARGGFDASAPNNRDGYYGAAFYFRDGTFLGSNPTQNGRVDIMRWDNGSGHYGGIRISGSDHKARLVRGNASTSESIGSPFTLREGCWNWLVVRQRFDQGSNALSEVFLNGRRILSSQSPNTFGQNPDRVQFGLANIDTATQSRPLDVFVDNSYVSNSSLLPPGDRACEPRPNILFIVTDDQRFGTVDDLDPSTDGNGDGNPANDYWMPETIRRFKQEGTTYPWTFAATPLCCPSRASIFTGQYAHNHGVQSVENTLGRAGADRMVPATTLQRYLKDAGYRTGIFGKYLNEWITTRPPEEGAPPYFDEYALFEDGYDATETAYASDAPGGQEQTGTYTTTYVSNKADSFIRRAESAERQPWFAYVAPFAPHLVARNQLSTVYEPQYGPSFLTVPEVQPNPSEAPFPNFLEGDYGDSLSDKPLFLQRRTCCAGGPNTQTTPASVESSADAMLRSLKSVDDMVERLFTTLEEMGELENTIAIYMSDNGFLWGEHYAEGKLTAYTNSIRVPMYVRWPGEVGAGATDTRLAANIDLAPTALAAAGVDPPSAPQMDGRNLLDSSWVRDRLLFEYWYDAPVIGGNPYPPPDEPHGRSVPTWSSIRSATPTPGDTTTPHYQYTEITADPATYDGNDTGFVEYYDLRSDPWQLTNRPGDAPSNLASRLASDRTCAGRSGPSACP